MVDTTLIQQSNELPFFGASSEDRYVSSKERKLRKQYLLKFMGLEPQSTEAACDALLNDHCMRFTEQGIESLMDLAITKANQHLARSEDRLAANEENTSNNDSPPVLKDKVIMAMIESLELRESVQPEFDDGQGSQPEEDFSDLVLQAFLKAKEKPQQLADNFVKKHEDESCQLGLEHGESLADKVYRICGDKIYEEEEKKQVE